MLAHSFRNNDEHWPGASSVNLLRIDGKHPFRLDFEHGSDELRDIVPETCRRNAALDHRLATAHRKKRAADLRSGLLGDHVDRAGIGDVLDEQCLDVLALDLVDQLREVACRWFGFGADPSGARNSMP